ncbi:MAG: hypothetical protein HY934_03235 [Candidatus Firestonebacteria bacterium]|nr:hypothetical protein [Candidatus Firestonebacteria bacterium]
MHKKKSCLEICIIIFLILLSSSLVFAIQAQENTTPEKNKKTVKSDAKALEKFTKQRAEIKANPHLDLDCTECHAKTPKRGVDTVKTVTFIENDFNSLCTKCHSSESNIHPVGVKPPFPVPEYLPLSKDGKNNCVTCHDPHAKDTANALLRGFDDGRYVMRTDLCYDCHKTGFAQNNPHLTQTGKRKCLFCHSVEPELSDTEKTVAFKVAIFTLCDFCHNVVKKNHPMNVDETVSPPEELPRDADGNITCATCHNPHGTSDTVHYLRKEYVLSLEEEKYINPHFSKTHCTSCHLTTPTDSDSKEDLKKNFKYKGNFIALCNSCHGASANIHPVDIIPPSTMKVPADLPLNDEGKVTCITCHDVGFNNRGIKYLIRGGDKFSEINELCFRCHNKEDFKKRNPHVKIKEERKCMFCHIVPPIEGEDTAETVKIKGSIRLLCIRCHSDRPHPGNFKHWIRPSMVIPKQFPLDDGSIACSTCHDPHMGALEMQRKKKKADTIDEASLKLKEKNEKEPSMTKGLRSGFACKMCHIHL